MQRRSKSGAQSKWGAHSPQKLLCVRGCAPPNWAPVTSSFCWAHTCSPSSSQGHRHGVQNTWCYYPSSHTHIRDSSKGSSSGRVGRDVLAVAFLSFLSQALKDPRAPWHWPAPLHHTHHSPEWWVLWAVMAVQSCALGLGHRRQHWGPVARGLTMPMNSISLCRSCSVRFLCR